MNSLDDPAWSTAWYLQGYFPLYDMFNRFYWERLPERAVLPVNAETVGRARAMGRRPGKKFTLEKNRRFKECIRHLQNPRVKEYSWVRAEVVRMYEALRSAGLLVTVEALDRQGKLAGGLVAIVLPGVLVAETMFTLEPDASKLCLCRMVEECGAAGFSLIDVQTRHDRDPWGEVGERAADHVPHPCVRLGEEVWPIRKFMVELGRVVGGAGVGSPRVWVAGARQIQAAAEAWPKDSSAAGALGAAMARFGHLAASWRWCRMAVDAGFAAAVEAARGV